MKKGEALLLLFLNLASVYAIRKAQANEEELELNGIYLHLTYTVDINLLGKAFARQKKNVAVL
jgi:hypothetical protein